MPDTPKSSRHKNVTMTPAQRAKWKSDVSVIVEVTQSSPDDQVLIG